MYKIKRFSQKDNDKLVVKKDILDIPGLNNPSSNLIKTNLPDGFMVGTYYDFLFIPDDEEFKNDNRYRLRFNSSSFGDDEFKAIVEIKNGIAAIYKYKDYEY